MTSPAALITGAVQGIGRAIAIRLAQDGFDIFLNDLPSKEEEAAKVKQEIQELQPTRQVYFVAADVSKESDIQAMFDTIANTPTVVLKVVVANAGICPVKPLLHCTVEDINATFAINYTGVFLCYKYGANHMIERKIPGRLIAACSLSGKEAMPMFSTYSSSKFAVRGLTQCAAQEFGPYGITVNAYAPGFIQTEMTDLFFRDSPDMMEQEAAKAALNRRGQPQEVAGLVSFFASDSSSYVSGQTINVDGARRFD